MEFSSVEFIRDYSFRNREELCQALNDLEAMYNRGEISEYQYKNTKKLLEDKMSDI